MYRHVGQIFFLQKIPELASDNGFQKSTHILPQRFNQQDLKNSIKYSEMIYQT